MDRARPQWLRGAAAGCVALACAACTRRAPGPLECRALAEAWLGVSVEEARAEPRAAEAMALQIQSCLTEPYDRELVHCVVVDRASRQACRDGYLRRAEQRRAARDR